jgi:hypothetical protein
LAAWLFSGAALCAAQATRFPAGGLQVYEVNGAGPSYDAALKDAELHAVRSAAGEFYGSDEMLLARSLLDRYLENYYSRFVASQHVLARRESQGNVYLRVAATVDVAALDKDLRQKRFFYKPKRRPYFYVTIAETVNGEAATGEPISRAAIHEGLEQILGEKRFQSDVITTGGANVNLLGDAAKLELAREVAQRKGIEVLLTGTVDLKMTEQKKIHFDDYTFYRAKANLALIRVDDGKMLAHGEYEAIAGHTDPETAKRTAAARATGRILQDLIPPFSEEWERTMTDAVEYQLTVVGVTPTQADVIEERLQAQLEGAKVYRRSLFEDVLVLNVYYPPDRVNTSDRARIEKILVDLVSPQLKITSTKRPKLIRAVTAS